MHSLLYPLVSPYLYLFIRLCYSSRSLRCHIKSSLTRVLLPTCKLILRHPLQYLLRYKKYGYVCCCLQMTIQINYFNNSTICGRICIIDGTNEYLVYFVIWTKRRAPVTCSCLMRSRQGLPPAPAPQIRQGVDNHGTQQNHANWPTQGALTAQAVTAALANPYSQTYTSAGYSSGYTSSHYAQAYMQSNWPATNPEGYTISSTYVPRSSSAMPQRTDIPTKNGAHSRPTQQLPSQGQGSWYQFGHSRCTYKDCIFTGSQKSVEIHMMDRHLIYPPGWDSRKKQSDWDADPSLKG